MRLDNSHVTNYEKALIGLKFYIPQGVWANVWRKKKAQRKEEIFVSSSKVEVNTDDLYTDPG